MLGRMVGAATRQVFLCFRQGVEDESADDERFLSYDFLLATAGVDIETLERELEMLVKMVLIERRSDTAREWRLTPLGTAAAQNEATCDTIFRR